MTSPSSTYSTPGTRSLDREKHGEEEDSLHSDLWARLPESLIEGILAKLPFSSLVRFCSVCERWRELILSSELFPGCISGHGCLVCFEGDSDGDLKLTAFNSSRGSWDILPLQFLQVRWRAQEIVSAGGSLCFRSSGLFSFHRDKQCEFIVWNPLTKYGKRLQLPSTEELTIGVPGILEVSLVLGMVVDCSTGHYKLIIGKYLPGFPGITVVYDSCVDSWNKGAEIPEGVFEKYLPILKPTTLTCQGNLYIYFKDVDEASEDRFLKYDVEEQAWSWILMPEYEMNPYMKPSRNVIEQNGEILLVRSTYVLREVDQIFQMTFQVFKLQDAGLTWLRTSCLPFSRVCEDMPLGTQIDCLGHGNVMFLIRRDVRSSGDPKKISVQKWFHNSITRFDVISDWVEYQVEFHKEAPAFQIFIPGTMFLK